MTIEELNKLEEKVNQLVNNQKQLKDENASLKLEIQGLKKESVNNTTERDQIKEKVATLIALIDSIENE